MGGVARRMAHWLGDTRRLVGALFYWNARKSAWRLRGRRGHCPCQNESDDPIPGRVRCEAMQQWHEPARFRTVCPLLVQTAEGWRCSVGPDEVRSYWGRVWVWSALTVVALWLLAVTALWGALHLGSQPPVAWSQLAWPGRWSEIRRLQSGHLFERAIKAFGQGRLEEAHLMLSTARELDPANYDAALLLAQISMFQRSFLFSDELFNTLGQSHPEQRRRTAITYHDTLVAVGRMSRLAAFSVVMASADPARASVWVRSALLALRLMPAAEAANFAQTEARSLALLAPHPRLLLQAEMDLRQGHDIEALAALHRSFAGPLNPFYVQYQVWRLAELGASAQAQLLLDTQGEVLGEFEQRLAQVRLAHLAHDAVLAKGSFRGLLRLPLNPDRVERIAALLVTQPDAALFRELHGRLVADGSFMDAVDGASLWLAATLSGAPAEADYWRSHGRQTITSSSYPDLTALDFSSWDLMAPATPLYLLNVVTLPREVIFALLGRMRPMPGRTESPATAAPAR